MGAVRNSETAELLDHGITGVVKVYCSHTKKAAGRPGALTPEHVLRLGRVVKAAYMVRRKWLLLVTVIGYNGNIFLNLRELVSGCPISILGHGVFR